MAKKVSNCLVESDKNITFANEIIQQNNKIDNEEV